MRAADALAADGALAQAVEAGAAVLAVCAGYQIVGRSFPDATGRARPGLGLLDVTTAKSAGSAGGRRGRGRPSRRGAGRRRRSPP